MTSSSAKIFAGVNARLSIISIFLVTVGAIAGATYLEADSAAMSFLRNNVISALNVYYIPVVAFFLVFVVALLFTRYGNIRLGDDDDRPEFGNFTWFSMLFSCGMGIGLMFWSVAEPIYHFQDNPFMGVDQAMTPEAAKSAMLLTFFHWGLHPWATYVIVGLSLAYFSYRKKLPLTFRSALYPVFGDKAKGVLGDVVDIIAVFATVFGVATSLGLGVQQLNTGLGQLFGIPVSTGMQVFLVISITAVATISVASGLGRGIKYLSVVNISLSIVALALVLLLGPTSYLISSFFDNTSNYLANVLPLSIWIDDQPGSTWQDSWTTFYWAWWMAWSPFVGMFIARISRGRTIREFIIGVLLVPAAVAFLWITVFGSTALDIELNGAGGITEAVSNDVTLALYKTFEMMDVGAMAGVLSLLATVLMLTYFVTSADSGTLVVTTILANGHPNPPMQQRLIWGIGQGFVAGALLLGGGLSALQTASISAALPFSIVLLLMILGLVKSLRAEYVGPQFDEPALETTR
jgi:choline/glycine/proline betaine transport protein